MIQALQENAGRFALMVSVFCERLGWHDLEGLISKFQNRVSFGVRAEIAELTTIPYVKVLLNYGIFCCILEFVFMLLQLGFWNAFYCKMQTKCFSRRKF